MTTDDRTQRSDDAAARIQQMTGAGMTAANQHMNPGDSVPPGSPNAGENICPVCSGHGALEDGRQCPACRGSGRVIEPVSAGE